MEWVEDNLTFKNPLYKTLMKQGKSALIRKSHIPEEIASYKVRNGCLILPYGCLRGLSDEIRFHGFTTDLAPIHRTKFFGMPINPKIAEAQRADKQYQPIAEDAMVAAKGGVLDASCGSGKTIMGIEIIRKLGMRFLWLCGKKDLLEQTRQRFLDFYPDLEIGTITDGKVDMGADGTIATVQTMINIEKEIYENEFNVVVVDECHAVTSNPTVRHMYSTVLGRLKAAYKFGLTATPFRADGLSGMIFANIGLSMNGKFRPTHSIPPSKVDTMKAEYRRIEMPTPASYDYLEADGSINYPFLIDYISKSRQRNERITNLVHDLVESGRKVSVLCLRVEHCDILADMMKSRGINAHSVTGKSSKKERDLTLRMPDNWDVLISTVQLFKEGIDIKELDTVVMAVPIKDKVGIIQSKGRAERKMEGKKQPLFIYCEDSNIPYCVNAGTKIRRLVEKRK